MQRHATEGGLGLTRHARERTRQRGFRDQDLDLIAAFGRPTRDGYVLLQKDVAALRAEAKRILSRLDHLAGSAVIVQADEVLSVYRPDKAKRRRMLQQAA